MHRIICEWCSKIIIGRRKRFCSRACSLRFSSHNRSESTRRKISERMKGNGNPNYGKHLSDDHKRKISESEKGKIIYESTRLLMSNLMKGNTNAEGYKHTEDSKRRMSEAKRGSKNHNYGKHLSDDTKKKISESQKGEKNHFYGKHHTEESRYQIADSGKATRENYVYDPDKPQAEYRRKAIETYGYKCELCGCTEGILVVHHLDGNHYNDDIDNLCVLCSSCHGRIHPHNFRMDGTPDPELTNVILESRATTK